MNKTNKTLICLQTHPSDAIEFRERHRTAYEISNGGVHNTYTAIFEGTMIGQNNIWYGKDARGSFNGSMYLDFWNIKPMSLEEIRKLYIEKSVRVIRNERKLIEIFRKFEDSPEKEFVSFTVTSLDSRSFNEEFFQKCSINILLHQKTIFSKY